MTPEHPKGLDILGIGPVADAAKLATESAIKGAEAFLSRICLPASEEFGLLLRDKVSHWRARNALAIAAQAEQLVGQAPSRAHPRLVGQILDHGSWSDDGKVQEMWAGLLASSCSADGKDDSNMMFVDLLSRLSVSQVKLIDYACRQATKRVSSGGWVSADEVEVALEQLSTVAGVTDVQRLDREMDHLRTIGLLLEFQGGFLPHTTVANITPSPLALHMFARCLGFSGSPVAFYKLDAEPPQPNEEL